ncbi:MAG: Holliday junction branch migration protein RuvA [Alphaproteobacteria bacterium]|nr:Holliday junction branch migration protein RuvA [Alphaproteobacteria bacterium]
MIGKLTGKLENVSGAQALIDVQGVGYVVACSARTLRALRPGEAQVALLVETIVREDAISLYGFIDGTERDWFRLLTTVQGVGARVALGILGTLSPDQLTLAITAQDKSALTKAEGVGPKLAARLVTELKDKVGTLAGGGAVRLAAAGGDAGDTNQTDAQRDTVSALLNLGYKRAEAFAAAAAARAKLGANAPLDALIRASLGELAGKEHAA